MPILNPYLIQRIYEAIKKAANILLVSHLHPDGDSLAAILAFYKFLIQQNKKATILVNDKLPFDFNFLPYFYYIETDFNNLMREKFDLIVFLDCGDFLRSGLQKHIDKIKNILTVNIDHHFSNNNFGTWNLVMPNASSTSEILFYFFKCLNFILEPSMATCLLMGILTDTNFFNYDNTSGETIKAASQLIKSGAKVNFALERIYSAPSIKNLKLYGKALARLQIDPETELATTAIFLDDLEQARADFDDLEGLDYYLNSLHDVKGVLVLKEHEFGFVKGSLRTTRGDVDMAEIAKNYGGGGHKKAAGFKIQGRIIRTEKGEWKIVSANSNFQDTISK